MGIRTLSIIAFKRISLSTVKIGSTVDTVYDFSFTHDIVTYTHIFYIYLIKINLKIMVVGLSIYICRIGECGWNE